MKDVIIIPTYNEAQTIIRMIALVVAARPEAEIWVVDDSSPDGTANIVLGVARFNSNVKLISRSAKTGLGDAYKDVLLRVQKMDDIGRVVTMDADGSHDPKYINDMLQGLSSVDFCVGSRYVKGGRTEGWGMVRNLLSVWGNIYVRSVTGSPIHDLTAGFVSFKSLALKQINLDSISSAGYSYQIEFKESLRSKGLSFKEIPIVFVDRRVGQSKMSGKIVTEGILAPWKILFKKLFKS